MNREEKIIYENEIDQQIEFSVWSPFFIKNIEGMNGYVNNVNTIKTVGQDGSTYISSSLNNRNIVMQGSIVKSKSRNKDRMLNVLNKTGTLIYKNKDIIRKIYCTIESLRIDEKKNFQISLICSNPFWRGLNEISTSLVTWIPNLEFPKKSEDNDITEFHTEQTPNYWLETEPQFEKFLSEFGTGIGQEWGYRELRQIVEINNIGDIECPLKIVFRANGNVDKPYIQDVKSYEILRINKTLKNGDILEITTGYGDKNVYLNGKKAHQYLDFINSTWLQLKPGINLIKYGAEDSLNNLDCTIFYTPLYLGV